MQTMPSSISSVRFLPPILYADTCNIDLHPFLATQVLWCDDLVDDIPNTAAEIISGFATKNAYYIGNEKLGSVSNVIYRARMCLETANGKQVCQELNSNT